MLGTGKGVIGRGRGAAAKGILAGAVVFASVLSAVTPTMAQEAPPGGEQAAVVRNPPTVGEIVSFPQRDFVVIEGFPARTAATISVLRPDAVAGDDVVIGTATGTTDATGFLEVNHAGSECWIGVTPDVLPGDKIRVSMAGQDDQETTTANVTVSSAAPTVERNASNAPLRIVVHGTAENADGGKLPLGQLEHRFVGSSADPFQGTVNARTMRAAAGAGSDGTLAYDEPNDPNSVAWTAVYEGAVVNARNLSLIEAGVENRAMWLGNNPGVEVGAELTIYEEPGEPGPTAGCNAPLAKTAITDLSLGALNILNRNKDLVVSGVAVAEATRVVVTVAGNGTATAEQVVELPATETQKAWTATIPAAELDGLDDGRYQVTARFTGRGVRASDTRPLLKDTVAPESPTANPPAGIYATDRMVALAAERGATIRYTQNGTNPNGRSRLYRQTIHVTADQTVKAKAFDEAGNDSQVAEFAYVIDGAADPTKPVVQPGDEDPGEQTPGQDKAPVAGMGIVSFPERDFVSIEGMTPRANVTVQVLRGGAVIGNASGPAGADGIFEVNHPGGECWVRQTPDITAGDQIRVSVEGENDSYLTTVANVTVSADPPTIERNEAGQPVRILVHGTAQNVDGGKLPLDQLEHRYVSSSADPFQGTVNKRTMRAASAGGDGSLAYDDPNDPASVTWTAVYEGDVVNATNVALVESGVESRAMWLGADPASETDLTIYEHPGEPGPTAGCNAPFAETGITGTSHKAINIATAKQDLVVSGAAAEGIERVVVSLDGANISQDATFVGGAGRNGQKTWKATFTSGQVASQADGQIAITAQFFTAGNETPASDTLMLLKDTEAPKKATATPPGGAYKQGQTVALESDEGTIRYTKDGTAPTPKSALFGDEIRVGSSLTVKARVYDDAGNASPIASFAYEIGQGDAAAVNAVAGFDAAHTVTIGGTETAVVNVANENQALTVRGTVAAGATGVTVAIPGGDPIGADLTPGQNRFADQTWEATIPAADLKALGQGRFQITVAFAGVGTPDATVDALKDTVAPAKPTAGPKPGNFTRAQNVRLNGPAGATILYTTTAGAPRDRYIDPIRVTRTTTIRAQTVDEAGNTSPIATFKYTIRNR